MVWSTRIRSFLNRNGKVVSAEPLIITLHTDQCRPLPTVEAFDEIVADRLRLWMSPQHFRRITIVVTQREGTMQSGVEYKLDLSHIDWLIPV